MRARPRKHPRRCGELSFFVRSTRNGLETPPQMRGTPPEVAQIERLSGNTPADAGNSRRSDSRTWHHRKHPRRCGELRPCTVYRCRASETPPQMRGTRVHARRSGNLNGNTPADAGNSVSPPMHMRYSRKHPRRCGELCGTRALKRLGLETPPQMRGTPDRLRSAEADVGNTPADAGNSAIYRISTQSNHYILMYSHIPGFRSNLYY